jgi:aminoglycoside phosphotransferase family enzyme
LNFKQSELISSLLRKDAYNHKTHKIRVEETHISWIILTGLYAYKVKKEIKFGKVLDFSTLQSRKRFCQKEVMLNKILCDDMYKGVVKIVRSNDNNHSSDVKLQIADLKHKGKALEYAVKMREIPQRFRMDNLIAANKVSLKAIEKLSHTLVQFHHSTPTNTSIRYFGQPSFMKKKVLENFETLRKLYESNSDNVINKLEKKLISFIENNTSLFNQRIAENKVRDIHGDLYMKNIFIVQKDKFYLYDRIEFNDSLRYADVAEDVAHISMDLDYQDKCKFKRRFLSSYIENSNDFQLNLLVYFLMCYKACVRAKVCVFKARNEENTKEKVACMRESSNHLKLARSYIEFF